MYKELFHLIIPVAFITHSSIDPVTYLCEPCTVRYELFIPVVVDESWWSILGYLFYVRPIRVSLDMIVYCRIIKHVIHPLIFILLWLLFDVC